MYTPEFHSYHTAVMLVSDFDFVAFNNEHIPGTLDEVTSNPCYTSRRNGSIMLIVSPARKYIWVGLWVGL